MKNRKFMQMEIPKLLESKAWFIEKHLSDLQHPLLDKASKLLLVSDYACRQIQLLKVLLMEDECQSLLSREDYFQGLQKVAFDLPQPAYFRALRQFRHRHFLRLLLLELAGIATTAQVMRTWSDCADALILHAIRYCQQSLSQRYGIPRDEEGNEVELLTLAMGKLGGRELNYSSDVDLIFAYTAVGETDGEERIDNQHYFSRLVQQLVQTLQNVTAEGFAFRVDLRLRPNGDSGPLVSSLAAMETYYQEQGRDWERYAMVKARIIAESADAVQPWFERLIVPFVYRRYVDFSVIESLRSMKAMIEREVQLNPRLDDIKRGKGGIREVEFVIQNFQLIRGGRLPQLQVQNALFALSVLKREKLLPHTDALSQAYLFLRKLENALQSLNDQQTHSLPEDVTKQTQITLAMGYHSWEELLNKLHQYQRIVSYAFHSVLGKVKDYEDEKRLLTNQLASLWQGHVETSMAVNLLTSLGFANASHCYQMIHSFRHSPRCRRLTQGARMRLDRFMVMLLAELTHVEKTDEVLLQVMHLLENIVGRSAYLALLTENPQVLTELLFWFAQSPFITSLLVNQPFLLEVLLDQGEEWRPQSVHQLQEQLGEKLAHHQDIELQEEILRQFKLTNWLMAARAELYGLSDAVRIGRFLSDVAQVIVSQLLLIASEQLQARYPEMEQTKSQFAIIAYGKLGSREMNYASDLDLVFLHSAQMSEEALITRLTQKILHMLTTRSQSGVLYTVDTRLRPSGAAGLLVSHVDAFVEYQKNQAWTWEHQALLKARILTGNTRIKHTFLQLKKSVLLSNRDKPTLLQEVLAMRTKMEQHQDRNPVSGGLLDLEFLVQYLILHSGESSLARYTNTLSQLHHLFLAGILNKKQYSFLKKAYKKHHQLLHQSILRPGILSLLNLHDKILDVCREIFNQAK
ncbi:bifunctional [glutamate--ammonia ligase]-adenylyl-L-tyrosine phosphorylase/[glutamate--ammonia-ligase] adenylyltransferase [Fluoribacter dumoffii]|uniref:bifunctional [glutamate--ammonia ligase]-adenylyl-L-tyrosine phosphorylase/[glutamate--ammonia-ligase] adenylyltransferase n=1 Tax=Fluoribacter dumoffii TaxID=463 RepID=UPI002242DAC0|nr:bifunctional [glutamate--ammonia ligase]-adenylyl-L-tyrosine phosphorylase/[glutamate--ammonia-ligase] adenylyltransferase [Fluoribacter dumoffii]MCW8386758.1 bifunctional [glutamate--ammonia ligase]-adenylyl-L-tyrosine phosphorylase/[glutamate--ammonia-ligase] adenylyltransferase [Fluoribacter dumoffii]MCW8417707.1 bifunctional [glutamate--ammonia ligase]-adenylyl-L-tyrosine phosphorylase/[glutamate--ammonia-ligase] adenylyltransferase [Fluoribacter dumoffii]MCW8454451.1 bifunctional [glutam